MKKFSDDPGFKKALDGLSPDQQREVAVRFVEHVLPLGGDPHLERALQSVADQAASKEDLAAALRVARSSVLESHTRCGAEGDWSEQAGYFVARAAVAAIGGAGKTSNPAWAAAMSCRMARTCDSIESDQEPAESESLAQYAILAEYLN